jgi:glycosidase
MKDFGYDISDFKDVDQLFGTMDDFVELTTEAHKLGTDSNYETAPDRDSLIWVSVAYLSNHTSGREQGG